MPANYNLTKPKSNLGNKETLPRNPAREQKRRQTRGRPREAHTPERAPTSSVALLPFATRNETAAERRSICCSSVSSGP